MSAVFDSLTHLWGRPKPAVAEPDPADRRTTVANRASLGWQVGHECPVLPARIQEIGLLGAVLVAEGQPPSGQPLWLRLEEPTRTNWVEVKVVRVADSGEIRVSFPGTCPNAIYRAMNHASTRQHQMPSPELDGPCRR